MYSFSVRITHWSLSLSVSVIYSFSSLTDFSPLYLFQFQFVLLTDSLSLYLSLLSVLGTVSVRITHWILSLLYLSLLSVLGTVSVRITHGFSLSLSVSVICFRYSFSSYYSRILSPLYLSLLSDSLSSLFRYSFSSYYSRILSPLYLSLLSVLCTVSVRITHGFSLFFICLCYLF